MQNIGGILHDEKIAVSCIYVIRVNIEKIAVSCIYVIRVNISPLQKKHGTNHKTSNCKSLYSILYTYTCMLKCNKTLDINMQLKKL